MERDSSHFFNRTLGNFKLIHKLGEGSSGVVYKAEHVKLGVPYAVKILHPSVVQSNWHLVLREGQMMGLLRHENAVFIADFGVDNDLGPYLVMEYLEGCTLGRALDEGAFFPTKRIYQITTQICSVMSEAHKIGIIHRDLKPDNIFLLPRKNREVVKLLDFGIAQNRKNEKAFDGLIVGTPTHMSPEQCSGKQLTPKSDIYSLGIILYEMSSGRLPFFESDPYDVIFQQMSEFPPPLEDSIPQALRKLIMSMLEKEPSNRPSNMDEVQKYLDNFFETTPRNNAQDEAPTEVDLPAFHKYEKRSSPRAKISLPIEIKANTQKETIYECLEDLSEGGMFIRTDNPFPVGKLLSFQLELTQQNKNVSGQCLVIRSILPTDRADGGMGVRFISLEPGSLQIIREIIQDTKTTHNNTME